METPTAHNQAVKGQIAESVLMPGDPDRAIFVAEKFLTDAELVSDLRGMKAFTGNFNGKRVSVMSSGMGGASAGLYSYELFAFYGVEKIIRIGTAAGFQKEINAGDMVFAMTACTDSAYGAQYQLPGTFSPSGDFELLQKAAEYARANGLDFHAGSIFSSDYYSRYNALGIEKSWKPWADMGCLAQDMETYAIYCNAARFHKKAFSIVTNVYNKITDRGIEGNKDVLIPMIKTALNII